MAKIPLSKRWRWATCLVLGAASLSVLLTASLIVGKLWFFNYYILQQNGMYPGLPKGAWAFAWRRPYDSVQEVTRGDIVVFQRVEQGQPMMVAWRVMGLPGETVETSGGDIRIDGKALAREYLHAEGGYQIYRETTGASSYLVAYDSAAPEDPLKLHGTVPAGHLFVMGDDRHHSFDSEDYGPIPFESVVAKVVWP